MKIAIVFADGLKQINLTAENDNEKQALELFTANENIQLAIKRGAFGEERFSPFNVEIKTCQGGFLRTYDSSNSIMLVMSPKPKEVQKPQFEGTSIERAKGFTDWFFENHPISTFVNEDYKTGFREGIQAFIEKR